MKKNIILIILSTIIFSSAYSQKIGIKTNLLYDATSTINLGAEYCIAPRWTIDLSLNYNPWTLNKDTNRKIKHYLIQPEGRYWLCSEFYGHFFGANLAFAQYNVSGIKIPFVKGSENNRYEGIAAMAGLSYGYAVTLGGRWNLEATLGLGIAYRRSDVYKSKNYGMKLGDNVHSVFFTPTKLGISLIYMIR